MSALAETSACLSEMVATGCLPSLASEMKMGTLGWSRRRARFHSPFENIWWSSLAVGGCLTGTCVAENCLCSRLRLQFWGLLCLDAAICDIWSDSMAWTLGSAASVTEGGVVVASCGEWL